MYTEQETYKGYTIQYDYDQGSDSPAEWGNYEIVTFGQDLITDGEAVDYFTGDRDDKIKSGFQAKMRAGKAFAISYSSHGPQCNYQILHGVPSPDRIDGFIIFTDEYAKNAKNATSYHDRYEMAKQDLQDYTAWANGEVYGFTMTDPYGKDWDDNTSWGYYGMDDARQAAHDGIERHLRYDTPSAHAVHAGDLHR